MRKHKGDALIIVLMLILMSVGLLVMYTIGPVRANFLNSARGDKKYYEASWKEIYSELGLFPNYMKYLESYGEIWLGTDMKEYFAGRLVASEADSDTVFTVFLMISSLKMADTSLFGRDTLQV